MDKKQQDFLTFLSNDFGMDAWMTIHNFYTNSINIINTIEIYGITLDKLNTETNSFLINPTENDIVKIKQQVILDIIMKTLILIESLLVLAHSLSCGYKTVANNMSYYSTNLVDSIMIRFRKDGYNMRKILGLPNLKYLALSPDEQKFLSLDFKNFEKIFLVRIFALIEFYNLYRVIYGKTKHGLTYLIHASSNINTDSSFNNSYAECFSRIRPENSKKEMYLILNSNIAPNFEFFNHITVLSFKKELFDRINSILSIIKETTDFIFSNHTQFALNCGKIYLPIRKKNNQVSMLTSREPSTKKKKR